MKSPDAHLSEAKDAGPVIPWRPVSPEYPVHIRPLKQGGVEVAVYLEGLAPLGEAISQPCSGPAERVRKVVEKIAASLTPLTDETLP